MGVFVGEEKYDRRKHDHVITGMHNWLQFWRQEKAGQMNYLGYVGKITKNDDVLVSVRFSWKDNDPDIEKKPISSFLVGTSAPFEFAMLTLMFLSGQTRATGLYFGSAGPATLTAYDWKTPTGRVARTVYLSE